MFIWGLCWGRWPRRPPLRCSQEMFQRGEGAHTLSSGGWINLLEQLIELRPTCCLLDDWSVMKGWDLGAAERAKDKVWESTACGASVHSRGPLCKSPRFHQPGSSPTLSFWVPMEGLYHAGTVKISCWRSSPTSSPLPSPEGRGGAWEVGLQVPALSAGNKPHPRGFLNVALLT